MIGSYVVGTLIAGLELQGQSGSFDGPAECDPSGTIQYTGTLTVVSETEAMIEMDATAEACTVELPGLGMVELDGTLHFEGTTETFDVSGRWSISGSTASGTCTFDSTVTFSTTSDDVMVTGTTCGQDVSGSYDPGGITG